MPIYEYRCAQCGQVFEEWTRRADDNTTRDCPDCGGTSGRQLSNTSFLLKGGGWYVTDYGYRKGKDKEGQAAGCSGCAASTSSGSCPSAPEGAPPSCGNAGGKSDSSASAA